MLKVTNRCLISASCPIAFEVCCRAEGVLMEYILLKVECYETDKSLL